MTMIPTSPLFVNEERLAAGLFGISLQMGKKEIVQIGDFPKQKKGSADLRKKLRKKAVLLAGISFHLEKPAASFFDITSCFFDYQRL